MVVSSTSPSSTGGATAPEPLGERSWFAGAGSPAYAGRMSDSARLHAAARPATGSAWLVVLVLAALALTLIIGLAFSTSNTPSSIDGTTATSSELVEGP